jgi:hypothetical protein
VVVGVVVVVVELESLLPPPHPITATVEAMISALNRYFFILKLIGVEEINRKDIFLKQTLPVSQFYPFSKFEFGKIFQNWPNLFEMENILQESTLRSWTLQSNFAIAPMQ